MTAQNIPARYVRKLDQCVANGLHNIRRGNRRRAKYWRRRFVAKLVRGR